MNMFSHPERYLISVCAFVLALFSALGFYLITGEPKIASLVTSGHAHILTFAFGGILFALLMNKTHVEGKKAGVLAGWYSLTFLGPLALIIAGLSGNTSFLSMTSPIFEGSFVVLWLIMAWIIMRQSDMPKQAMSNKNMHGGMNDQNTM